MLDSNDKVGASYQLKVLKCHLSLMYDIFNVPEITLPEFLEFRFSLGLLYHCV